MSISLIDLLSRLKWICNYFGNCLYLSNESGKNYFVTASWSWELAPFLSYVIENWISLGSEMFFERNKPWMEKKRLLEWSVITHDAWCMYVCSLYSYTCINIKGAVNNVFTVSYHRMTVIYLWEVAQQYQWLSDYFAKCCVISHFHVWLHSSVPVMEQKFCTRRCLKICFKLLFSTCCNFQLLIVKTLLQQANSNIFGLERKNQMESCTFSS